MADDGMVHPSLSGLNFPVRSMTNLSSPAKLLANIYLFGLLDMRAINCNLKTLVSEK
jgi:hypothetical protein